MAARKNVLSTEVSRAELEAAVCSVVQGRGGLTGTELRRAIDKRWKGAGERAVALADELAAEQRLFRYSTAKTARYFPIDPQSTLPGAVLDALAAEPLTEAELKRAVERRAPGHGELVKEWVKAALARGEVHPHAAAPGSRGKRLGREPDVRALLKAPLAALAKALATRAAGQVPRHRILEVIAAELGVPWARSATLEERTPRPAARGASRELLLQALDELAELPSAAALLSLRELRARVALEKERFDHEVLALAEEGVVVLHHHDFPTSLSPEERAKLVVDGRGTHYVGIARRRGR